MEIKIPGVRMLRKRKDRGDPLSAATERPHLTLIMNNLSEMCERSGRPDVTSWERHENPNQVSLTRKLNMMEPRNPL